MVHGDKIKHTKHNKTNNRQSPADSVMSSGSNEDGDNAFLLKGAPEIKVNNPSPSQIKPPPGTKHDKNNFFLTNSTHNGTSFMCSCVCVCVCSLFSFAFVCFLHFFFNTKKK